MAYHQTHLEEIHYSLHREMNEFYWAVAIRSFAVGLLGVFVPIYVFLYFEQSVVYTAIFYAVHYLGHAVLVPWTSKLLKTVGVKKMMAIGNPLLGVYVICLMLAEQYGLGLIVAASVANIIHLAFFWPAFHVDFAKFSQGKKRGRQIGTINIIVALVKTLAPFVGGYIIIHLGFPVLFIVAAVTLTIASIPMFFSSEVYENYSLNWKQSFARIFAKKNRRATLAFTARGIESIIAMVFFPIFIYSIISNFETIGIITSISLIVVALVTFGVGWMSDKKGNYSVLNIAAVANAFAWVIIIFIKTPIHYVIYSSFLKFSQIANQIPFASLFYGRAKKRGHGVDEYIAFFEIAVSLSRGIILLIIALAFWLGLTQWFWYFALAAIAAWSYQYVVVPEQTLFARIKKNN